MPRKFFVLAMITAGCALVVACGAPPTNYYRLHYPIADSLPSATADGTLAVERFRASQLLRQDRIVYSTSGEQLNYYQYHRWADDPATMVTNLVVRQISSRGIFRDVYYGRYERQPDYTLRGRLLSLEELDRGGSASARVVLEAELVKTKTGAVIWSGRAERERPVAKKDVPSVVGEMSEAAREAISELGEGMAQAISRERR